MTRWYRWGNLVLPSVTSILQVVAKPALVRWAAKITATEAVEHLDRLLDLVSLDRDAAVDWLSRTPDRVKRRAAETGTGAHLAAELLAGGQPAEGTPETEPLVRQLRRFLDDVQPEFLFNEVPVYAPRAGYAGTADCFCKIGGEHVLLDIKTSKAIYPEYALQISAYAHAEFIGMPDGTEVPVPPVEKAYIVHVTATGWRLVPVDIGPETFNAFLGALAIFRWQMQQRGGQNDF
jgi:hypothetical protein